MSISTSTFVSLFLRPSSQGLRTGVVLSLPDLCRFVDESEFTAVLRGCLGFQGSGLHWWTFSCKRLQKDRGGKMKAFLLKAWAVVFIALLWTGVGLLFGVDPFFGFFTEKTEKEFAICKREIFCSLGDDLQFECSETPVDAYEVVCGYSAGIGWNYGTISDEWQAFEDGELIAADTVIPGAIYRVDCIRKVEPPTPGRDRKGVIVENEFFCPMPEPGIDPPRSSATQRESAS